MSRGEFARLPTDAITRLGALVERSAPDPARPRLPEDQERALDEVERKSARCYSEAEELTYQLGRLAAQIDAEPGDGVPQPIEFAATRPSGGH